MIIATGDAITPTELAEAAFESAGEAKKLVHYEDGHLDAYAKNLEETSSAAHWFVQYL